MTLTYERAVKALATVQAELNAYADASPKELPDGFFDAVESMAVAISANYGKKRRVVLSDMSQAMKSKYWMK